MALDQLRRRGVSLTNSKKKKVSLGNINYLYEKREQFIDHMIIHCVLAGILWQLIFSMFGLQWVRHSSIRLMLLSWNKFYIEKRQKRAWLVVLFGSFLDHLTREELKGFENAATLKQLLKSFLMHSFLGCKCHHIERFPCL